MIVAGSIWGFVGVAGVGRGFHSSPLKLRQYRCMQTEALQIGNIGEKVKFTIYYRTNVDRKKVLQEQAHTHCNDVYKKKNCFCSRKFKSFHHYETSRRGK